MTVRELLDVLKNYDEGCEVGVILRENMNDTAYRIADIELIKDTIDLIVYDA